MKILTVDIGTGTQDIFLYDSRLDLENGFKLVVPSPTMIVHRRMQEATRQRPACAAHGRDHGRRAQRLGGGGPHLQPGLPRLRHARRGAHLQRRPGGRAGHGRHAS